MRIAFACLFLALTACSGGGQSPSQPPAQPAPQPSGIGAAGGTVSNGGAQVVVPAGALTQAVQIAIAQTNAGAPPLPPGVVTLGPMFAFTPHGTAFASPATVTLPYDPSLVPAGTQLQLYKTDSTQSAWQSVALTSTGANSVTAQGDWLLAHGRGRHAAAARVRRARACVAVRAIGTDPSLRTAVARYNANGTLDTSFAIDGKIVAGGLAHQSTDGYGLVRVNP